MTISFATLSTTPSPELSTSIVSPCRARRGGGVRGGLPEQGGAAAFETSHTLVRSSLISP